MPTGPYATVSTPYPNRIALWCNNFVGPFLQMGSPPVLFNPLLDLAIYVDGVSTTGPTWSFDTPNNRYLLYMQNQIDLQGVIQVIYHMPNPPFKDSVGTIVPGFALIGSFSPSDEGVFSFFLQEDDASLFLLEGGTGAFLVET